MWKQIPHLVLWLMKLKHQNNCKITGEQCNEKMHRCSHKLAESSAASDVYKRQIYTYAVDNMVFLLAPLVMVLVIGSLMHNIRQGIVMIIPFMLLRKFSGGYHAKTLFRCMIISCLLLFLCMEITIRISYSWNILMFAGIAGSSLIIQSPIDSENKRLEEVQKRQYRKIVCGFVMFFLALIFILWKLNAQKYAVSIAVGIWLSAGLQIPCLIK